MRGSRVKSLRTEDRPNPGRKGGGSTKIEVRVASLAAERRRRRTFGGKAFDDIRKALADAVRKPEPEAS